MIPAWLTWGTIKALPWKWIALGLAVLSLVLWIDHRGYQRGFHKRDAEVSALNGTITNMKAASAKAKADNLAHVQTVETKQDQVTKDKENDAPKQLADARAALAAYVRLHPATAQGDAGRDPISSIPDAAGKLDAAPSEAIVPVSDLDACAKAYVTATGLQDWIRDEAAIVR